MANYSTLKAAVADVVKTNGTQAITGANLQAVLLSIINSVGGGGYIFKGVATPSTDAGTPDENVFYLGGAGTYANFGTSITVPVGSICVFKYNGSWTKEQIKMFDGIDDEPTANSNNLVKSGGVYPVAQRTTGISYAPAKNLFDYTKSVDGYFSSNGTIQPNPSGADWKSSNFIPVKGLSSVIFSYSPIGGSQVSAGWYFLLTYNDSKQVVSFYDVSPANPFSIGENIAYIRFSYHSSWYTESRLMVESGTVRTEFEPFEEKTYIPSLDTSTIGNELKDGTFLEDEAIKPEQTSFMSIAHGKNLLDRSIAVDGYLNANGTIHANSGTDWKTSDFIDVSGYEAVTCSDYRTGQGKRLPLPFYFLVTYTENKTVIGQDLSQPTTYTIEQNVHYIRFSFHDAATDLMVESGSLLSDYEEYKTFNIIENSDYARNSDIIQNTFKGKRWCVLGDSFTEKNARAVTSYYDYIAIQYEMSILNKGVSGTGYARGTDNFMSRVLTLNPNNFDVITIFGSFNDAGAGLEIGSPTDTGTTTLCGCINTTLDNYYSTAPFIPIGLITPCAWAGIQPNSTFGNSYADAIVNIAKLRGIPCLDLFRCCGIRPWAGSDYLAKYYTENGVTDTDGVHPNSLGHKVFLYPHIRQFLCEILD